MTLVLIYCNYTLPTRSTDSLPLHNCGAFHKTQEPSRLLSTFRNPPISIADLVHVWISTSIFIPHPKLVGRYHSSHFNLNVSKETEKNQRNLGTGCGCNPSKVKKLLHQLLFTSLLSTSISTFDQPTIFPSTTTWSAISPISSTSR